VLLGILIKARENEGKNRGQEAPRWKVFRLSLTTESRLAQSISALELIYISSYVTLLRRRRLRE